MLITNYFGKMSKVQKGASENYPHGLDQNGNPPAMMGAVTKKTKMNDTNPVDDNIPMSNLDEELIVSILDYLRLPDIENFTNTCKTWGSMLSVSLLKPV